MPPRNNFERRFARGANTPTLYGEAVKGGVPEFVADGRAFVIGVGFVPES